jgi:hypothetical protein
MRRREKNPISVNDYPATATNWGQANRPADPRRVEQMSIKTKLAAATLGALTVVAITAAGSGVAAAACSGPPNVVIVHERDGVTKTLRCYYLPTVSNGRVTGLEGHAGWITSQTPPPRYR